MTLIHPYPEITLILQYEIIYVIKITHNINHEKSTRKLRRKKRSKCGP